MIDYLHSLPTSPTWLLLSLLPFLTWWPAVKVVALLLHKGVGRRFSAPVAYAWQRLAYPLGTLLWGILVGIPAAIGISHSQGDMAYLWWVLFGILLLALFAFLHRLIDVAVVGMTTYLADKEAPYGMGLARFVGAMAKLLLLLLATITLPRFLFAYDMWPWLRSLSLGTLGFGAVVGLASQDMTKNFFGGFLVIFEQPFVLGDHIKVGAVEGQVLDISLRATKVATRDGSTIYVPNALLTMSNVANYGRTQHRPLSLEMTVEGEAGAIQAWVQAVEQCLAKAKGIVARATTTNVESVTPTSCTLIQRIALAPHSQHEQVAHLQAYLATLQAEAQAQGLTWKAK